MQLSLDILIVDDEEAIREILADIMSDFGATVKTAGGGEEAISLCVENSFDVILSDMRMPDMNGEEFFKILEQKNLLPKDFYFITGGGKYDIEDESVSSKITGLISKPFREEKLLDLLKDYQVN